MVTPSSEFFSQLTALVGAEQVCAFAQLRATQQDQIRQLLRTAEPPAYQVAPQTTADLAALMVAAHQHRWPLLICGQGTKLTWGGLTQNLDLILSLRNLNQVIDHDQADLTITVQAGLTLKALQEKLAPFRQFLAVDPAYPEAATIGGLLATGDTGGLRHRYGGLRDMCLGITFLRADGQIAKAGGRVVKNVAGYDLMKLLTGSYGSLAVITEVTLRLYPLPEATTTLLLLGQASAMAKAVPQILNSGLTPIGVDLLSPRLLRTEGAADQLGLAIRVQGSVASVTEQAERIQALATAMHLDLKSLAANPQRDFWQKINQQLWPDPVEVPKTIICKFGLLPAQATTVLAKMEQYCQTQGIQAWIRIYAGKGGGVIRLQGPGVGSAEWIEALRSHAQQAQGFLTLLAAPPALKQTVDVWGYTGTALGAMQKLKQQFDPYQLLNPHRFVGDI